MNDYELINGKPHLGNFYGTWCFVPEDCWIGQKQENPIYCEAKIKLEQAFLPFQVNGAFEIRHVQMIERPPYYQGPLCSKGTLGIKFMVWGRAFLVKRLHKKGIRRYANRFRGGKRKVVRIDK